MYKIRLFICVCLFSFVLPTQGQTLLFKNYSVNQGLASSTVYSIFQDSRGFIWFGTESGVNRFDGKTFEWFTVDDGLSDNEVLHINEDSKGRIWFLTLNGKLSYFYNAKFYNPQNSRLLARAACKASFISFYEDSRNRLWFSTNQNKLLEIDGDKVRFLTSAQYPLNNVSIFENQRFDLLAMTRRALLSLDEGRLTKIPLDQFPVSSKSVVHNPLSKSLKFLSDDKLLLYKNDGINVLKSLPTEVPVKSTGKFIVDHDNNLWISTMGNGLYRIKAGRSKAEQLLEDQIVTDVFQDLQGNIWASTIGAGVFMLPAYGQSTVNLTTADGLSSNPVHSILKAGNKLVLGLRNGRLNYVKDNRVVETHLKASAYNPIKALHYDTLRKSVWFATNNSLGTISLQSGKVNHLDALNGHSFALKAFSISRSGKLALALASGIYLIEEINEAIQPAPQSSVPEKDSNFRNRAFSVFYDSDENLWFANINGLYCYDPSNRLRFKSEDQASQRITDIAQLPDGSILCSTSGSGILLLKDLKKRNTITTSDGLPANVCREIVIYGNEAWVATSRGISQIDFNRPRVKITNYSTENGLMTAEVNGLAVDGDSVYAATNNGVSIFSTQRLQQVQSPPKLYLNSFQANKTPLPSTANLRLPYKQNNITITYNAIDFEHPSSIRYSYKLNPELKWNETTNSTLEFASLQPGEYHLQLRARSINSGWSEPVKISFTIKGPVWQTWWFIVLLALVSGSIAFYLINRYYKAKRIKENERLLARTKIISLEQQALQAMMNPHFVFNVMNSIQYFINTKDNAMANQALTGFARLLRKNLENCNKSYITIEEEISYLNLYLSLEKMRFGERMNYHISVDKDINPSETLIPSMLLQPYVENAIWHGLMPKDADGNIWISIEKSSANALTITITDDGIGIQNSLDQKTEGHISRGMQLTNERIRLLNKFKPNPIQITVEQVVSGGTKVSIIVPM